jgi:hypothetical protein
MNWKEIWSRRSRSLQGDFYINQDGFRVEKFAALSGVDIDYFHVTPVLQIGSLLKHINLCRSG